MDFRGLPSLPLCVDLDGTLIRGDCCLKAIFKLLQRFSVWSSIKVFYLNLKGRPIAKHYLAQKVKLNPSELKYNKNLLNWLYQNQGKIDFYLVTGAPQSYAEKIAHYLSAYGIFFKEVFGSSPTVNLVASQKANLLRERFGHKKFIYIGNSAQDKKVWIHSLLTLAVNPSLKVRSWIKSQRKAFLIQKITWGERGA